MGNLPRPLGLWLVTGVGLVVFSQYLQWVAGIHNSLALYSAGLANLSVLLIVSCTLGALIVGGVWLRRDPSPTSLSSSRSAAKPLKPVKLTPQQVRSALSETDSLIEQVKNDIERRALQARAQAITSTLQEAVFHVVVFGLSSAGKTSLINALLGGWVGETAPTMGTTQEGSVHTYSLQGVHGSILLTDTPGLQTIGQTGESEAKTLAAAADLLIFVVAGDLLASEYEELLTLAKLGKRAILALNKTDLMLPEDVQVILAHLRRQTQGVIPADSVVAIAAQPQPLKVRHWFADGSMQESYEPEPPDTHSLVTTIAHILHQQGSHLRLANALLKTQTLTAAAQEALQQERHSQGKQIVERMQWATAAAVVVTPLPALDVLAAIAINARMIGELHALFDRRITLKRAQQAAQSLADLLLKLGGVELATQTVGSALKASPLALMGIPLQAASAAYLTRVAGLSYLEWLGAGIPWQEEDMLQRVKEHLHENRPLPFLSQLARRMVAKQIS
ncbi:MAG: GTP-binding protein [Cyanobacteriota bacterium]|nr:GTP-binding protein [Cyanobacteriota bacterium]